MASASVTSDPDAVERSRDRRADAMTARSVLWAETSLERVRSCGRWSVMPDGAVTVRAQTTADGRRVAGYAGLATCGSVWACPVCSRKIAASRQSDIEHAAGFWETKGGAIALATLTVSHRVGNSLKSIWSAVSAGWGQVTSGSAWKRNEKAYGIEGWCRVVEVTHGRNGWHVHIHAVLFLHHGLGPSTREKLTAALHGRWNAGLAKHGFTSSRSRGADVKMMHGSDAARVLSDYFVKGVYTPDGSAARSVGLEAARGDLKETKGGSRTPFRVLQDFIRSGDVEDLEVWHEWERSSKGRRQMAWSKGFRDFVGLCAEKSDEDLAAEELGSSRDDVLVLPRETVKAIAYTQWIPLDVLELGDTNALRAWLHDAGLRFYEPNEPRPA